MVSSIFSADIRQRTNADSKSGNAIEINGTQFSPSRLEIILGATTKDEATASKKSLPVGRIFHPNETMAKKDAAIQLFNQINNGQYIIRKSQYENFVEARIAPDNAIKVVNFFRLNEIHPNKCTCEVNNGTQKLDFKIYGELIFSADKTGDEDLSAIQGTIQHILNNPNDINSYLGFVTSDTNTEQKTKTETSFTGLNIRRHTKDFLNQGTLTGLNIRKNIKSLVTAKVNNEERNSSESERESFESGFF